jgi:2-methylfumaryl-CoA isomerase
MLLDDRDDAPLAGLRIIEVSSFVAAPLGGMTLAQLGAEVIRIDPLGGAPDTTRWPLAPNGGSLYWAGLNKGKRSVTLDLRSPEGQRTVADLVASSGPDGGIVLTNAGYPWLSYDAMKDTRPDLIHLSVTGKHDGSPAVDYTVNAGIGFPLTTGDEGTTGPVNHVLPAWDVSCGLYAAVGILAAERHRRRTGAGRAITLALADVALAVTGHLGFLAEGQLTAVIPRGDDPPYPPEGRPRIGNHLYGGFARDFRTRSGDSVMVVTLTARHYADLARVTGTSNALAAVERALGADFTQDSDRYAQREVIAALIAPWFAGHTTGEVTSALAGTSVLWERYRTFADLAADPKTLANPIVSLIDQPGIGAILATGSPLAQPGTPQTPVPAPVLGADTEAILGGCDVLPIPMGSPSRSATSCVPSATSSTRRSSRSPRSLSTPMSTLTGSCTS